MSMSSMHSTVSKHLVARLLTVIQLGPWLKVVRKHLFFICSLLHLGTVVVVPFHPWKRGITCGAHPRRFYTVILL